MAIRTARLRLEMLSPLHQYWRKKEPEVTPEEEAQLRARIAELVKTIDCPLELLEKARDWERKRRLEYARLSPTADPFTEKTKAEEAQLMAVEEAYSARPEVIERWREHSRLSDLSSRDSGGFSGRKQPLTAAERSELESLRARYPEPPAPPEDPFIKALRKARAAEEERQREIKAMYPGSDGSKANSKALAGKEEKQRAIKAKPSRDDFDFDEAEVERLTADRDVSSSPGSGSK